MNTDFSELSVMQLSDSFFPSGLYTMSNGLETVFDEKRITTADGIQEFIHTIITQQIGPADCVALLNHMILQRMMMLMESSNVIMHCIQ